MVLTSMDVAVNIYAHGVKHRDLILFASLRDTAGFL
jgi:hypothetical protein